MKGKGMLVGVLGRFLGRLRFPQLFSLAALLLVVNLIVPDPIPFLDEALLAIATIVLGQLRSSDDEEAPESEQPPMKNVTPKE